MLEAMNTEEWIGQLEEQKRVMLAEVSAWPAELRDVTPADGGWSALGVLDHLVRTESGICCLAAQGLATPRRIGVRDRIGFAVVERVFRSRRRVKVPGSVATIICPGEGLELGAIAARWERVRVELSELAGEAEGCCGGVFRHPVSGWMTFEQILRFFSVHIVHHEYQLERIQANLEAT
jgi:hypothetical protein